MIKKFETSCDMGSVKVFNDSMSAFFSNSIGDVPTVVYIIEKPNPKDAAKLPYDNKTATFLGHFTVKTIAYLSDYDCGDNAVYTFKPGRWFVNLLEEGVLLIEKVDEDLHA